jgi:hypothetical protein
MPRWRPRARLEIERPDDIESVTVEADPAAHSDQFGRGPAKRRPTQVVEAQFAQPFLIATALVHGKVGLAEVDGLGDGSGAVGSNHRRRARSRTEKVAQHHGATDQRGVCCEPVFRGCVPSRDRRFESDPLEGTALENAEPKRREAQQLDLTL